MDRTETVLLVCRHCGMEASDGIIRALLDERVNDVARCFCGGIEWDIPDGPS